MTKKTTTVLCDGLDDFGRGIVRIDGKAVFVEDLLPGERAVLDTFFSYGKLDHAEVQKRLNDSPDRVKPRCPYYPSCGGCQIQHLAYDKQLLYKQQKVKELLHKFAHLDVDVLPTLGLENPWRFRNKVQKPVRYLPKAGKAACGFYRQGTHDLVAIDDCLLESELATKITKAFLSLLPRYRYRPYDEDKGTGEIRHLLIKTSSLNQALVTLVVTRGDLPGRVNFARDVVKKVPEIVGVVLNVNPRHTNVILGERDVPVYGKTHLLDVIFGKKFLISTQSFYQTNTYQIETLYQTAIDFAGLRKEDRVLDSYCGTGTIGLSLADKVKEVVGVEIVPSAVRDAVLNAKNNDISNARFYRDDATKFLLSTDQRFDVVLMDPPRKGSTPEFIGAVKKMKPRKVVYVSCDPVTLSRDLALFKDGYEIEKVQPVDLFPHSLHVETVVSLAQRHIKDSVLVSFTSEELPITKTEASATYQEIQKFIYDKHKIKVSTLDIAQVKEECGIKKRDSYNHPKSDKYEQPKVTEEKKTLIKEALKEFKML